MFIINDLSVKYHDKEVLSNLSLTLNTSSVNGIVGYNGAGKTTLLNSIYDLTDIERNKIKFNGKTLHRSQIAYLESENFFYSNITGRDYLNLFRYHNSKFDIDLWQSVFRLPLDSFVETYSTGMKKKLALLGVISSDKDLIILDEPFNGLDLESVSVLQIVCRKLAEMQKTIIITSHILETLTSICDSISVLENGNITSTYDSSQFDILIDNISKNINEKYCHLINDCLKY